MDILALEKEYFLNVYKRFPAEIEKGEGAYLIDKQGNSYLDFLSGIAVNSLGHKHPSIIASLQKQIERNLHLSNYFVQDIQVDLAKKLLDLTPFSKAFLTNSGTEAIEGLLKLVRKWGNNKGKNEIIAFEGSFHGRSIGSLSITIQDKYQKNFTPLLPNIITVPFNKPDALKNALSKKTAAIFYEGITGEGGIHPVSDDIFSVMAEGRTKYDCLLIADEIQTGVGRTGKFYYYEYCPIIPDAVATAKGLGGGLPLGAFLVSDELTSVFDLGEHGTTFGGNPLACAAGYVVLQIVSDQNFLNNVEKNGLYLKQKLSEICDEFNDVTVERRGKGFMQGLELTKDAAKVMMEAFKQGLIINTAGDNTLRFLPPLIIEKTHIDEAYHKLIKTLRKVFYS
ncbi:MAG: acetylornithine/succinylornithine family transaminase [Calditrichaceae bacterium]|nr:acetylornithine/succinylornithine family transaminase [Calditrichaceae bacterium]HES59991.1 acetylornithine/succinylornithine family transaminase [Caldithrix sp.]